MERALGWVLGKIVKVLRLAEVGWVRDWDLGEVLEFWAGGWVTSELDKKCAPIFELLISAHPQYSAMGFGGIYD